MDAERSALDDLIAGSGYGGTTPTERDRARAELVALRARVEDLELIVLTNAHESNFYVEHGKRTGWRLTEFDLQGFIGDTHTPLAKDDHGLPILTDEARAALRGPEREALREKERT